MKFLTEPTIYDAYVLSWVSMVCTILAFFAGLAISVITGSAATLGYSLENAVDTFSSALVLWRFWGGGTTVPEKELELREKRASIGIAMAFIILAIVVGSVASTHLAHEQEPTDLNLLVAISLPSIFVFLILGILKLIMGRGLNSASLVKDGICSVCGGGLSAGVYIGAVLLQNDVNSWWLDAAVAVVVSAGLFVYGHYTLIMNGRAGNKWWTKAFWSNASESVRRRDASRKGSKEEPKNVEIGTTTTTINELTAGQDGADNPV